MGCSAVSSDLRNIDRNPILTESVRVRQKGGLTSRHLNRYQEDAENSKLQWNYE